MLFCVHIPHARTYTHTSTNTRTRTHTHTQKRDHERTQTNLASWPNACPRFKEQFLILHPPQWISRLRSGDGDILSSPRLSLAYQNTLSRCFRPIREDLSSRFQAAARRIELSEWTAAADEGIGKRDWRDDEEEESTKRRGPDDSTRPFVRESTNLDKPLCLSVLLF